MQLVLDLIKQRADRPLRRTAGGLRRKNGRALCQTIALNDMRAEKLFGPGAQCGTQTVAA